MSTASVEGIQLVLRVILAGVFIFMGVLHFRADAQRTMAKIIPPRLRFTGIANPRNLVIFTGVCEIAGGIGLLLPATSVAAAIALAVFLVAVFPANAFAAAHPERFGRLAIPFGPRLTAQIVMIALVLFSVWKW
ncbi:DoxX family membrane protein [Cryobacterium melibiosiphilum]|uniref:DoxX family membrane protein n=1 Tax=Cryobacterium melibiosiphilum TaxID=995039 RepID=A0A3A5MKJ7_9MICO|nr:DoxX family protein [Cryobacterium melibiosiphilum]RJT84772.1 DoxX family membrane protein [Cryobacterium melibiosiphilum]